MVKVGRELAARNRRDTCLRQQRSQAQSMIRHSDPPGWNVASRLLSLRLLCVTNRCRVIGHLGYFIYAIRGKPPCGLRHGRARLHARVGGQPHGPALPCTLPDRHVALKVPVEMPVKVPGRTLKCGLTLGPSIPA